MMTDPKKRTDRTTQKATAGRGRKGRLDVPSVRIRRRRIDAGTTSRPYGVSPSPHKGFACTRRWRPAPARGVGE